MLPADPGDASAAAGVSLLAGWIVLVVTLQANSIVLASTSFSRKHSRGTPLVVRFCKKLFALPLHLHYTNAMASACRWRVHLFWGNFCVRFLCICKTMRL